MRLKWHLVRLVLAALLPLVVLSSALVWSALRADHETRQRAMVDVARGLSYAVDGEIERTITALAILGQSDTLTRGDMKAFRVRAAATLQVQQDWASVLVLQPDGTLVMSLSVPEGEALPALPDLGKVLAAARTGRPQISDFLHGSLSGEGLVFVAVPVFRDGRVKYVVEAVIHASAWTPWLARRAPAGWTAAIDDRAGYVIGRSAEPERFVGRRAVERVREAYTTQPEGVTRVVALTGEEAYVAFHTSPLTGWHAVVLVPTAVADAGANRVALALIGVLIGTIAIAVIVALWTARPLASGIAALAEAIARLGHGERPSAPTSGVGELDAASGAAERAGELLQQRGERVEVLQAELAQRADSAERTSRAKDEFLAMLSHELRTPLAAIVNAAAVLRRCDLPGDAARMSGVVDRQARHLATMVEDLLDVSRVVSNKVALKAEAVDLGLVAARVVNELRAAGRLGAHEVTLAVEPAIVRGDPDRLVQVVRNLVDNALKYTPGGGRVAVRVGVEDARAVVRVTDSGVGIEPALAEHLFEPFVQGAQSFDRPAGGLGLGLAIVRGIVTMHGGTVQALSGGTGRGAEFVVRLPLAAGPAAVPALPPAASAPTALRVAVIEDHDDTRVSLRALLEDEGHSVREAVDGESGLALLVEQAPDLAFVDLGLPRLDGFGVAARARRDGVRSRLVALTGYAQPEDRARALKVGFDAVLVKPATTETLRAAVAEVAQPARGESPAAARSQVD